MAARLFRSPLRYHRFTSPGNRAVDETKLTTLILILAPIAFVGFWCATIWIVALASGWRRLAQAYAVPRPIPDSARSGVSGMVGWAGYNHVLRVAHNDRYLYLDVMWIFRVGHSALRIPWSDITIGKETRWLLYDMTRMEVGRPSIARLRLPTDLVASAHASAREASKRR